MRNSKNIPLYERIGLWLVVLLFVSVGVVEAQGVATRKYWIYFRDKGNVSSSNESLQKGSSAYGVARDFITSKALARRAKVMSADKLIDFSDLPVSEDYVHSVEALGARPITESRWLNAVSAYLTEDQLRRVVSFPFVQKTEPVSIYKRMDPTENSALPALRKAEGTFGLDYGPSLTQLNLMQVPRLHDLGITGRGILVGMLDTGFRWKWHEALRDIKVVGEYDFINNRDTTANGTPEEDRAGQDSHGTETLSTICGFMPGKQIGPAFGSSFMLGKTEWVPTETRIEEDYWVAGIEWLESKGVDVVSSSLGYDIFDDGTGYTFAHGDFNGRTGVTTRAAVMAARKGVVVVTAMGNEQNGNGIVGTMITPADADSIISSGAVGADTALAGFSSTGPTNDGRIKPDVVAMGRFDYVATPPGPATYAYVSGTSFSTPLTAGVAALVLSARPELTPIQVRNAIRNTAVRFKEKSSPTRTASYPNNFYGWGLVSAYEAVLYHGLIMSNVPQIAYADRVAAVGTYLVSKNPIDPSTVKLKYSVDGGATFSSENMSSVSIIDATTGSGRYSAVIPYQVLGTTVKFYFEASDMSGLRKSPFNAPDSLFMYKYGDTKIVPEPVVPVPTSCKLFQNYPNPFNPTTIIRYDLPEQAHVSLKVYDILGRAVQVLTDGLQPAGRYEVPFNATMLATGVYFYELRANEFREAKKMIIAR
jgi:subtilisin family serine protease